MAAKAVYIRRRVVLLLMLAALLWGAYAGVRRGVQWVERRIAHSRIRVVAGSLKPGQVLFDSLLQDGVSREAANELLASLAKVLDLTKLQVKDEYRIYLNEAGRIEKFIYEKSPADQYFSVRGEYGALHAFKPAIFLNKEQIAKKFTIKSSLSQAMHDQGERDALVFAFVDVFAWDIDFFTYPRVGDEIRIYFEKYSKDGKFVRYGRVLAAEYRAKGRENFAAVHFQPKKEPRGYYDLAGKPTEKMFLKTPLKFTGRITSFFGRRRDPFTHRHDNHTGVDFAAPYGSPIVATSGGMVSFAGWRGAYGRLVIVKHANGFSTYYGHCAKLLVRSGQRVEQGQTIATVGSTGRSTGPHCHYEIRTRGATMDPLRFNQPKRQPLSGKELADFKEYSKKIWEIIVGI